MQPLDPGLYARSFADIYDAWYSDLDDPLHLVRAFQKRLSPGATIVELGGGTGRLARPLARAGFCVISLDVSAPMLAKSGTQVHALLSDMACIGLQTGCSDAVFVAYNTILNLPTIDLQRACITEAHRLLRPGGTFALEAFVAPTSQSAVTNFELSVKPHPARCDASLAILTGPGNQHGIDGHIVGSHIELTPESTTCRPWRLAYQSPTNFDTTARSCGLTPTGRWADWAGTPFTSTESRHVSWYKRPLSSG